jgi:hypothetical protein
MKKLTPIALFILFFIGSFILSYKNESSQYVGKDTAKKEVANVASEKLFKEIKSPDAVYLSPGKMKEVFENQKVLSFKAKGVITNRYIDPYIPKNQKNELFLEYWADPETIKSLRLKEPLFKENKINLSIQTYTWAKTGAAYSIDNFQFFNKPYKTKAGLYAYFSRSAPPTAFIAPPNDDRFIVVTASNTKILLRALNNLVIP